MKIVLIHGQNHKGCSYNIGKMLADKITTEKEITEFFLPRDLNHFCTGCYSCIEDDGKCPFYNDKSLIMEEVEKADLLIFTTPTYCMRSSAPMKSFLDLTFTYWMPHKPKQEMFSKKAVVISTAAGTGADSAVKDIKTALFYWGIPKIKTYGIAVQATDWDSISEKKKAKINSDMTKLAKSLSPEKKTSVPFKTKFIFNMMRMMQKHGMGASPTERNYWLKNGWLDKIRPWKIK